ncbi:JmjC domain-containing protein [Streptomyces sp. NBRC 110028]|uniref:JmjC domain-containing protein n=1 Tax=Streptomyces sp. NBRC 110028 TaxID=1621260 RepID=UPI0006E3582D|nr:cupin domain-containing protein [Streptomyces sp. NBRC 110028]
MRYQTSPPELELSDAFYTRHWERGPLHVREAASEGFSELFDSSSFEELLAFGALRSGFVTVIYQGRPVAAELLCHELQEVGGIEHDDLIDPQKLTPYRDQGGTVILASLHLYSRKIAEFAERLSNSMGCTVEAHAFHTPAHTHGLAPHFDGEPGFLLQLEGTKHWTLHPPLTDPLPIQGSHPPIGWEPDEALTQRFTVEPGDLLYLPRGWIHYADTAEQHSLHVTFQALPNLERDVILERIEREVDEAVRREDVLPVVPMRGPSSLAAHVRGIAEKLAVWADELDSHGISGSRVS